MAALMAGVPMPVDVRPDGGVSVDVLPPLGIPEDRAVSLDQNQWLVGRVAPGFHLGKGMPEILAIEADEGFGAGFMESPDHGTIDRMPSTTFSPIRDRHRKNPPLSPHCHPRGDSPGPADLLGDSGSRGSRPSHRAGETPLPSVLQPRHPGVGVVLILPLLFWLGIRNVREFGLEKNPSWAKDLDLVSRWLSSR